MRQRQTEKNELFQKQEHRDNCTSSGLVSSSRCNPYKWSGLEIGHRRDPHKLIMTKTKILRIFLPRHDYSDCIFTTYYKIYLCVCVCACVHRNAVKHYCIYF